MKTLALFLASAALSVSSSMAGVVWDEAVNGNLSNNRMAPTPVAVSAGLNSVRGSLTGNFGDGMYYDYVTFKVPAGFALTGLFLDALTNPNNRVTILGIAKGTTFPADQFGMNINQVLGWTGVNPATAGADLLPALSTSDSLGHGNSGFTIPLGAGNYSLWIQDYDTPATYQYSLRIEAAVPPVITVKTKKVVRKKATISGVTTGSNTEVSFRVGKKGSFKRARGKVGSFTVVASNLKKGSNLITIRAKSWFGTSTAKVAAVVKK